MPKIIVLPKNIAELIAAGEVVERPASVVKELCENALDAGAKRIIVELKNGGLSLIRVTDDGCGIAREDVRNAFQRNATSKVRSAEELYAIATLGFRGEALPSIAAMARVELLTRTDGEVAGTRFVIEGGEETALEDVGCPTGTTFLVRDLFYNTPARQKFMKSNRTEGAAASVLVEKLALSHPEVAFRLIRDGAEDFSTAGDGDAVNCARRVLGKEFAETLLPISLEEPPFVLSGFVSRPESSRGTRAGQNIFINGRYVRSRTVSTALEEAYSGHMMTGRYPACLLYLTMPFAAIDVNVHPSKLEIRFSQEKPIYDMVYSAVRTALEQNRQYPKLVRPTPAQQYAAALHLQQSLPPEDAANLIASQMGRQEQMRLRTNADLDRKNVSMPSPSVHAFPLARPSSVEKQDAASAKTVKQTIPLQSPPQSAPTERIESPEAPIDRSRYLLQPEQTERVPEKTSAVENSPELREKSAEPDSAPSEESVDSASILEARHSEKPDVETPAAHPPEQSVRIIGEVFHTYILAESGDSLLLVDKHAAHERLLYEKLKQENLSDCRQVLISPVVLKCARAEYALLTEQLDVLEQLGFLVEDFGGQTLLIREVPAVLAEDDAGEMVLEIAGKLRSGNHALMPERMNDILHSIACRAAVKAHDESLLPELCCLMEQLLANPELRNCPHGRPVYLEMTRRELEKQFGRLG